LRGPRRPFGVRDDGPAGEGKGTVAGAVAGAGSRGMRFAFPPYGVRVARVGRKNEGIDRGLLAPALEQEVVESVAVAVQDEGEAQLGLRRMIHLRGHDAEIEADVDQDGADRAAAVLGDDFLGRGQEVEVWILDQPPERYEGRFGVALFAFCGLADGCRPEVPAAGVAPAEQRFEGCGAEQPAGDAGEDQREIGGAEDADDEGEAGEEMGVGGVLTQGVGESLAVCDERADQAEDLAGGT